VRPGARITGRDRDSGDHRTRIRCYARSFVQQRVQCVRRRRSDAHVFNTTTEVAAALVHFGAVAVGQLGRKTLHGSSYPLVGRGERYAHVL
jgi:hypothetical protein